MLFDINKKLHYYFREISNIPRKSGEEEAISQYLLDFAKEHQLEAYRDELLNVVISKPGTVGKENHETIMIQGHTDMVCEKEPESNHDFKTDKLEFVEKDGFLYANKTTLGADNGVAVAYMLTLLDAKDIAHPPLECVFTSQEETGLFGAAALDMTKLKGIRLINLDCGPENATVISCAGGCRMNIDLKHTMEPNSTKTYKLTVGNIKGGHSGMDINKNRLNANMVLFNTLKEVLDSNIIFNLVDGIGGMADNAIPRDAYALITLEDTMVDKFKDIVTKNERSAQEVEQPATILLEEVDTATTRIILADTKNYVDFFVKIPYGPQSMSASVEGLVEVSMNAGVFSLKDGLHIQCSIRSTNEKKLDDLIAKVEKDIQAASGSDEVTGRYPGWDYDESSVLRDLFQETYEKLYQEKAEIYPIHAGLECGYFKQGKPELDIIAIGPNMEMIHTPKERLDIASFDRVYNLVVAMLEQL